MPFSLISCCSSKRVSPSEDEVTTTKKVDDNHPVVSITLDQTFDVTQISHFCTNLKIQQRELYSPALALSLFDSYADPDTASSDEPSIGPEGFEKLCHAAQISLEGALPLVLAWMLDSKEMAKIGKSEWIRGTSTLR